MIRIPFSFMPGRVLYRLGKPFFGVAQKIENRYPSLDVYLHQAEADISPVEYIAMCLVSVVIVFLFLLFFLFPLLGTFELPFWMALSIAVFLSLFVFIQQMIYPKLIANRRIKGVEKNLLPSLQDMMIQLNAGVPLFNILANIANGDYGEVSNEFSQAIRKINAGRPQVDVLEEMAVRNPSVLFRRALWQIVNGMKEGADISSLIRETIQSISDEQLTQIQRYGGQLSPLALFYMLIAVIAPSLGVTFIIIISTFVALSDFTTKLIFYGVYGLTFMFQLLFLGMIKTRRPSLLGD